MRAYVYMHWVWVCLGKYWENMIVTVSTGTKDLTICMTGSKNGKKNINKAAVLSQGLAEIRHFLLCRWDWYRCTSEARVHTSSCTSACHCWAHFTPKPDAVYQADPCRGIFHLSMHHFMKAKFSVDHRLCYKESRTVDFVLCHNTEKKE